MRGRAFVGRRRELDRWHGVLAAARRGAGAVVVLAGEPGVGKTALLRRFAADATQAGALAVIACAYEGEWQPPYASWAEALGAVARSPAGAAALRR